MFFSFLFLIFKTSSIDEIPPDITKGVFVKFVKLTVSLILGPVFVPSLFISVYTILEILIFLTFSINSVAKIFVCFFQPDKAIYPFEHQ